MRVLNIDDKISLIICKSFDFLWTRLSKDLGVEFSVSVLNLGWFIILVHFWKRVAVSVKIGWHWTPPDWEVLGKTFSDVWTVWGWLTNKLVESLAWSFPCRCLNTQESSESNCYWESQKPTVSCTLNYWSHEREAKHPSCHCVSHKLSWELLKLPIVKLLHSEDFIICKIIIIKVCKPIPVLSDRNLWHGFISSI